MQVTACRGDAHRPARGVYRLGRTLTAPFAAGPTFKVREDGQDGVTPSLRAGLRQTFRLGSASLANERSAGTAGGLDLVTELVQLYWLLRGLSVEIGRRYASVRAGALRASDRRFETHTSGVGLPTIYRIGSSVSLDLGCTFYQQRSGARPTAAEQDRAAFGAQFGYPLRRD